MSKTLKQNFDELPAWVKFSIIAAFLVMVFFFVKFIADSIKKAKQNKVLENSQVNTTVNGVPVTIDLGTRASAIHAAFYDNDWFGLSENEDQAMTELMNVPKSLVPQLSKIYYDLYGKNLKSEFQKYLSTDSWNKISNMFSAQVATRLVSRTDELRGVPYF